MISVPTQVPARAARRRYTPAGFDTRSVMLFAGLALGAALAAHAQATPDGSPAAAPPAVSAAAAGKPDVPAIFARADANHDGQLSRIEAERLPDVARNFDRVDSNHDGSISLAELRSATGN
ncbi:EF-hand domain-containing protein [Xylophilus sp. GW821-FHT01B05]